MSANGSDVRNLLLVRFEADCWYYGDKRGHELT